MNDGGTPGYGEGDGVWDGETETLGEMGMPMLSAMGMEMYQYELFPPQPLSAPYPDAHPPSSSNTDAPSPDPLRLPRGKRRRRDQSPPLAPPPGGQVERDEMDALD